MQRLLGPGGCPWDQEQTLESLRPFLIEEAYEVLDAIDGGHRHEHCEELGDLLLQIVFQSELAQIPMQDIIQAIGDKLIRRHPHVFGDEQVANANEVLERWDQIKKAERAGGQRTGVLDTVPKALPALHRSHEITRKLVRTGFLSDDLAGTRARIENNLAALSSSNSDPAARHEQVGELLLASADLARQLGIEPEQALRDANRELEQRYRETSTKED